MGTWSGQELLQLWEQGARRHAVDRALLLAASSVPEDSLEALADLPLGALRARLLDVRRANFGRRLSMSVTCPSCGTRLELTLDADLLPHASPVEFVEVNGRRVRPPTSRDLAHAFAQPDADSAERVLARRCFGEADDAELAHEWFAAAERALEEIDSAADLTLDLSCEACQHDWLLPFDLGAFLWAEVETKARALMGDVHLLATAYGWSEREILSLSDARRAAYLAMVGA